MPASDDRKKRLASTGRDLPADGKVDPNAPATAASYGTDADNTKVNERDRERPPLTPMDQGGGEHDVEITQPSARR